CVTAEAKRTGTTHWGEVVAVGSLAAQTTVLSPSDTVTFRPAKGCSPPSSLWIVTVTVHGPPKPHANWSAANGGSIEQAAAAAEHARSSAHRSMRRAYPLASSRSRHDADAPAQHAIEVLTGAADALEGGGDRGERPAHRAVLLDLEHARTEGAAALRLDA